MITRLWLPCLMALSSLTAGGCYSPAVPNGTQQCGLGGACPSGYVCGLDARCYKMGQVPKGGPDMSVGDLAATCTADLCKNTPAPVCDPDSKQCVACLVDGDCPSGKVCQQKACVPGCSMGHGCPDGGGTCDPGSNQCKKCGGDGDCGGNTPRCDSNSGRCVACLPANDNCPMGFFCGQMNGAYLCQSGCQKDPDCLANPDAGMQMLACCNHVCTDTLSDGNNCGLCGTLCGARACCGGGCVDTVGDPANCGGCGMKCVLANATAACNASKCAVGMCDVGFADCDKLPGNGCEINTTDDSANCGGCAKPCPVNNACVNSVCKPIVLYAPIGPQQNIPVANLIGWTQCYLDTYSVLISTATVTNACPKAKLMLACRTTGNPTLQLLSWAPRADVLFDTGMTNVTHDANGAGWYFSPSYSWGYAKLGDVVQRSSCDVAGANFPDQRLCWHTVPAGGYRCGSVTGLNSSVAYERIVYQAD